MSELEDLIEKQKELITIGIEQKIVELKNEGINYVVQDKSYKFTEPAVP